MTVSDLGKSLVEGRCRLDAAEAEWLGRLVAFDRSGQWALDGHLGCVSWLVEHCGLARSTAKERLRVAWELARRPIVAESFARGDVSYSKVRAITRIVNVDEETDRILIETAQAVTAPDMDKVARHYELIEEQERPVDALARWERRGLHRRTRADEMAVIETVLPIERAQRLLQCVDSAVDKAPAGAGMSLAQRRVDALCDLVEAGLAHLEQGGLVDPEVAMVSVVVDYETLVERANGSAEVAGGAPLSGEAARRLACDAGLCRIITRGRSEVLDVGRQTRRWNRAQRRAIRYRHGGRCAFPGCERTITQIHHCTPWADDGNTDVDAGVPVCWGHHVLVHEGGWAVKYDGHTGTTIFTGPDGQRVWSGRAGVKRAA